MEQEFLLERMALAEERIGQIPEETSVGAPYDVYFQRVSRFITRMFILYRELSLIHIFPAACGCVRKSETAGWVNCLP